MGIHGDNAVTDKYPPVSGWLFLWRGGRGLRVFGFDEPRMRVALVVASTGLVLGLFTLGIWTGAELSKRRVFDEELEVGTVQIVNAGSDLATLRGALGNIYIDDRESYRELQSSIDRFITTANQSENAKVVRLVTSLEGTRATLKTSAEQVNAGPPAPQQIAQATRAMQEMNARVSQLEEAISAQAEEGWMRYTNLLLGIFVVLFAGIALWFQFRQSQREARAEERNLLTPSPTPVPTLANAAKSKSGKRRARNHGSRNR